MKLFAQYSQPALPVAAGILPAVEPVLPARREDLRPTGGGGTVRAGSDVGDANPGGRMPPSTSGREARRYASRQRGFTLVEILVALAILGMIVSAIYATWILILRSSAMAQFVAARAQRERIAVRTVEDALICSQSFQASMKYYSFIVINGEEPILSFTARVPEVFPRNGKFNDMNLRRLNFTLEEGTGEEHGKNLVLRQNPILMDMDEDEKKFPLVLAHGVKTFGVDCWDTNKLDWVEEWDNTNAIPPVVRIRLQLDGDANAADATALTVVRLVAMPCEMMPANIQMPNGGGPGGPGGPGLPGVPGGPGGLPPLNPGRGR